MADNAKLPWLRCFQLDDKEMRPLQDMTEEEIRRAADQMWDELWCNLEREREARNRSVREVRTMANQRLAELRNG